MFQGRKTIQLNDGNIIPILGYGTAKKPDVAAAITMAITEADMRHLDCAERYNNEVGIGKGLKKLDGDRSELFVTSKLEREPRIALTDTLESLGLNYVDLYLIHNPNFVKHLGLGKAWQEMETLQAEGKARSIGVSNYRISDLEETLKTARVIPAVNQIEVQPYMIGAGLPLIEYCKAKGITIAVFSALAPLTHFPGGPVDPVVREIAAQIGSTEDQVLLKWAHQVTCGGIVLTTSLRSERLRGQIHALEEMEPLSESQMQSITSAGRSGKHQRVYDGWMDT
ncbi:hypothetical protein NliqN6_1709 [Naganishia liquefaciens]|uniref:NADP-dependent oxidoreductase domain-containing protein n=1 Tax=Naganishia liquefaciens TaxID=104408 RepID=A0A8H3TQE0_9TREE|nr:hypothetical protein NliqN6_1709 [Naganishia liquefaciens]